MTQRLVVRIDETWPTRRAAPWVVLDDRDRVVREGQSEPAHWPATGECEVVLGAPQCTWLETVIPRAAKREQDSLLRYAVEPLLAGDPDGQHLTLTHQAADTDGLRTGILVTSRNRLRSVLAQLAEIGHAPSRAVSELQGVRGDESAWTLALATNEYCVLGIAPTQATATDRAQLTDMVTHALQATTRDAPPTLEVVSAPGVSPVDLEQLGADTGLAVRQGAPWYWWQAAGRSANLLHGEFAPRHARGGWRAMRAPAMLAAAALGGFLAINTGYVLWQRHELEALEERMRRIMKVALPDTPAIAPAQQLHRHLDDSRSARGQLRDSDLLSLLLAYSAIRGAAAPESVRRAVYGEGKLEIELAPEADMRPEDIARRFTELGYQTELRSGSAPILTIARRIGQ